ncbi:MAG TPA: sigma 54-interacting transcriptional regulator [Gemmatimonadales bacterium]
MTEIGRVDWSAGELLGVLRRVTEQMTAQIDLSDVLRAIADGLVDHAGAVAARLLLYQTDSQCPVCRAAGLTDEEPALHDCAGAGMVMPLIARAHKIPMGAYFAGRIAESRMPMLINDLPARVPEFLAQRRDAERRGDRPRERVEDLLFLIDGGFLAYAGYPLLFRDELIGTLGLFFARAVGEAEFDLLGTFAYQAATAIKTARALDELSRLRERLEVENAYLNEELRSERGFDEIIGTSPPLRAVLRRVRQVAPADSTVLLIGETGTGKELVARAIHRLSPRRDRSLIKVNCAAIPSGLVESELFGHERGAFTGAVQRRLGRFELADGGTLFLDEVGELPLEVQAALLRVLQEQEFERVGGSQPVQVDVRLVAATNRDLEADVAAGRFRADLFYRLNVFPVPIPPLRERVEDIPMLVAHFVQFYSRKLGRPLTGVSAESLTRLARYPWPGNVRELQNVMERACVLSPGPVVVVSDALSAAGSAGGTDSRLASLEDIERAHIRRALDRTDGVIHGPKGAARLLEIHPNTLRSRMERLGLRARKR